MGPHPAVSFRGQSPIACSGSFTRVRRAGLGLCLSLQLTFRSTFNVNSYRLVREKFNLLLTAWQEGSVKYTSYGGSIFYSLRRCIFGRESNDPCTLCVLHMLSALGRSLGPDPQLVCDSDASY